MTNPMKLKPCQEAVRERPPICADFDEDCDEIADKVHCWLYDPAKGRCPYLSKA